MLETAGADEALRARVEREREYYNKVEPKLRWRDRPLTKLLRHVHDNPSNKRGLAAMRNALMPGHGGHVLEIGCRSWPMFITHGSCRPRKLTCINISESELEIGKQLARESKHDFEFEFLLMDAHDLKFPDGTFDQVFGGGILHHLDYRVALPECRRVLKPGGGCAFTEPLRLNPLGRVMRLVTKGRTDDELALGPPEIAMFEELFDANVQYFQLAAFTWGLFSQFIWEDPRNPLMYLADRVDRGLLETFPALGPYCRLAVLDGRKRRA